MELTEYYVQGISLVSVFMIFFCSFRNIVSKMENVKIYVHSMSQASGKICRKDVKLVQKLFVQYFQEYLEMGW